ncbi:Ima1 N-terminal domain-containing protein [Tirmania nivea]|nr:Ima1 N-terminal domain-containing protein [Tirmania nivea]
MIKSSFGRRRRLTCFFCGHKTNVVTIASEPVTSFTCSSPYCQSVNQLDKEGNIVDYIPSPPQTVPPPAPRYGRPVRSPSPEPKPSQPGPDSPVFCRRCEKHLAIKNNLLSDYLPPEDHPDFQVYWDKLPEFKRQLEERYPEPCVPCAEKAQQRIKQANYLARTAMIGRYLKQGQNLRAASYQEPWGFSRICGLIIWVFRGIIWYGLHALVIAWHAATILYPIPLHDTADISGTWGQCIKKTYEDGKVHSSCQEVISVLAGRLLWVCPVVWSWNYRALQNARKPKAKLTGYDVYMLSESILVVMRLVSWVFLTPGWIRSDFPTERLRKLNFVLLVLSILGWLYSITALKLVMPTSLNMKEAVSPLGANTPDGTPPKSQSQWNQQKNSGMAYQTRGRAPSPPRQPYFSPAAKKQSNIFPPISSFERPGDSLNSDNVFSRSSTAMPPQVPRGQQYSNDDVDEMDWNPTFPQKKLPMPKNYWNPFSTTATATNNPPEPDPRNPFAAPVPAAPKSSMFQSIVRGQAQQPQQLQTNAPRDGVPTPRESFFRPANGGVHGISGGTGAESRYPPMAEAKFFPKNVAEGEDTGLEGLISGGLKLEDEPEVVRNARAEGGVHHRSQGDSWWEVLGRLVLAGMACTVYFYLGALPTTAGEVNPVAMVTGIEEPLIGPIPDPNVENIFLRYAVWAKMGSLIAAFLCPVWKLMRKQSNTPASYEPWDLGKVLLAAEGMAGVMLLIFTVGGTNLALAKMWGKMYVGWVLARKVWDTVVFLQSAQLYPHQTPQVEPEPPRRREISPGLGEWPLPPEQRHAGKAGGAGAGAAASGISSSAGRTPATLRRDGSNNLSGGFRRENSGGIGGMSVNGVPGIRRDGSGGLSRMVNDAGRVGGMGMGMGMGGNGGLRREAGGGLGGVANGGWGKESSFRKENSGGGGFGGLSLS